MKKNLQQRKVRAAVRIAARVAVLAIVMLMWLPAMAQQRIMQGKVLDETGSPLVGATVTVVGSTRGTTTTDKGVFSIKVQDGETLAFQYLGYQKVQRKITSIMTKLNVTMLPDKKQSIEEIVVIGYDKVKKSDLTGSVVNVKMDDIKDSPAFSVDHALQGRVAGAEIMATSGEPGAVTSIRIRGTRSISANNEPLIVVDGVMDAVTSLNDINPAEIEAISILKDASSTAIYGSRGANGVILITTKKGRAGSKPAFTFKADVGFSQLPRELDVMNATEFAIYRNDVAFFNGAYGDISEDTPLDQYPIPNPYALGEGTNWQREIFRTSSYQNYNVSGAGGSKLSSWFVSLGYNDTEGIIENSGAERINGRINLSHRLFRNLLVNYQGSYTHHTQDENLANIGGTHWWDGAIYLSPMLKVTDTYNPLNGFGAKINTPRVLIDQNTRQAVRKTQIHTMSFDLQLMPRLVLRSQNTYNVFQRHLYRYFPSTLPTKDESEGGEAFRADLDQQSLLSENTLKYNQKSRKGHSFDVMGGYTAYRSSLNNFSLNGKGYMNDRLKWNNMNAVGDKKTYNAVTSRTQQARMSFFSRVNYNYKGRYYLTATGRYDGSSNFAANHKWGFFPSGAFKWVVSREKFMKNVRWIDEMSLRLSAGRTGNDAISIFRSQASMSSTTNGYMFDGSQPAAYYRSRLGSPDLTWEKTDQYNVALDFSLFKNRLNITAEGYISKTKDLLLSVQVANQTGFGDYFTNIGATSNKGIECSIESRNIVTPKFQWSTSLTMSHNVQMVDNIGSEDFVVAMKSGGNNPYMMQGYVAGYPLNALWGFRHGGVWKSVEEFERNDVTKTYASAGTIAVSARKYQLGTPRYKDINHDGTLGEPDLVYLGNADPYLYGGIQNTFRFENFRLGVFFNYSLGGYIYNYSELYMAGGFSTNQYRYMLNSWHPVRNPESNFARAGAVDCGLPNDRMVHSASYLRLKNVSLSYTLKLKNLRRYVRDITLNFSAENLWLWKKYNGYDPDVSTSPGNSALRHVDMGAYPKPRTYVFSIQIRY